MSNEEILRRNTSHTLHSLYHQNTWLLARAPGIDVTSQVISRSPCGGSATTHSPPQARDSGRLGPTTVGPATARAAVGSFSPGVGSDGFVHLGSWKIRLRLIRLSFSNWGIVDKRLFAVYSLPCCT